MAKDPKQQDSNTLISSYEYAPLWGHLAFNNSTRSRASSNIVQVVSYWMNTVCASCELNAPYSFVLVPNVWVNLLFRILLSYTIHASARRSQLIHAFARLSQPRWSWVSNLLFSFCFLANVVLMCALDLYCFLLLYWMNTAWVYVLDLPYYLSVRLKSIQDVRIVFYYLGVRIEAIWYLACGVMRKQYWLDVRIASKELDVLGWGQTNARIGASGCLRYWNYGNIDASGNRRMISLTLSLYMHSRFWAYSGRWGSVNGCGITIHALAPESQIYTHTFLSPFLATESEFEWPLSRTMWVYRILLATRIVQESIPFGFCNTKAQPQGQRHPQASQNELDMLLSTHNIVLTCICMCSICWRNGGQSGNFIPLTIKAASWKLLPGYYYTLKRMMKTLLDLRCAWTEWLNGMLRYETTRHSDHRIVNEPSSNNVMRNDRYEAFVMDAVLSAWVYLFWARLLDDLSPHLQIKKQNCRRPNECARLPIHVLLIHYLSLCARL